VDFCVDEYKSFVYKGSPDSGLSEFGERGNSTEAGEFSLQGKLIG